MPWFRRKRKDDLQHGGAITIAPAEEVPEPTELEQDRAEDGDACGRRQRRPEAEAAPRQPRREGSQEAVAGVTTADGSRHGAGGAGREAAAETRQDASGRTRSASAARGARDHATAPAAAARAASRREARAPDLGRHRRAARRDSRGRPRRRGLPRAPERRSIAGNIYLGVVDNVLPGWRLRSSRSGSRRTAFSTWTRSSSPSSRASGMARRSRT